jgi:hypothetical protein
VGPGSAWGGGYTSMELNKSGENLWVLLIALSIRTRERICEHENKPRCYRCYITVGNLLNN